MLQISRVPKEASFLKTLAKTYVKFNRKISNDVNNGDTVNIVNNVDDSTSSTNKARFNEINLQMLSKNLYEQIFGHESTCNKCDSKNISAIKEELAKFDLGTEFMPEISDVHFSIPPLQGNNIEEHFENIALEQVQPYTDVINKLLGNLPPIPEKFLLKEGWTRYTKSGPESVEFPLEDGLVFDVEVCMKNGPLPVLATAVSPIAWYGWVSKHLIEETQWSSFMKKPLKTNFLIPLESARDDNGLNLNKFQLIPKIIVGHSVSYDRIRVKEQYWLNKTATRFLDTMALHVSVSGNSSYQRALLKSKNADHENDQLHSISSLNNLVDVYKLYCGKELDKTKRDVFIEGEIHEVKEHFNESMLYCALDVLATHEVLQKVYPLFLKRFPHPATLAGMLELSLAYLPVNRNWKRYMEESETTYEDFTLESKICLSKKADQECRLLITEKYKTDPWMWDEDWSIRNLNMKKGYEKFCPNKTKDVIDENKKQSLNEKFKYLNKTRNFLPKKIPNMAGYPNWYRKLCHKQEIDVELFPKAQNISTSMQIAPKILNLTWENYPLHYIKDQGWGFLVPHTKNNNTKLPIDQILVLSKSNNQSFLNNKPFSTSSDDEYEFSSVKRLSDSQHEKLKSNYVLNSNLDDCCYFFKLPHKNGEEFNVGNPLAKDFINKFSENILAGADASASRILNISKMCSYWKNNRNRILSQLVIWLENKQNDFTLKNRYVIQFGAIIPQVIVSGTLTRRAVEPTWMTASNANSDRIGSELRAMINAPPNYSIIGADVDSQELWIASIIGDAYLKNIKIQGATPFSWMTLIGNKAQGTDMHSMTAKAVGISREQAKIINYARIYGAGQRFAERLLKQFNPTMTDREASSKSKLMFSMTKGKKLFQLRKQYFSDGFDDKLYTATEAFKISKLLGKSRYEVFEKGQWIGGSESAMFNSLEEIAAQKMPVTPFLKSRLSRALEKECNEKHLPTKVNWVVQSSAVDFLHLMLVCMRWLMKDKARLCLTFHDEVRYLVPSKYKYNAALAMHVTNLLVRSFFVYKLNMKDLPMSVAFFTAVEVDSVLRKEASHDCKTPSNPHGLLEGYGIEYGESLNIWTAIEKSKGCVGMLNTNSNN